MKLAPVIIYVEAAINQCSVTFSSNSVDKSAENSVENSCYHETYSGKLKGPFMSTIHNLVLDVTVEKIFRTSTFI